MIQKRKIDIEKSSSDQSFWQMVRTQSNDCSADQRDALHRDVVANKFVSLQEGCDDCHHNFVKLFASGQESSIGLSTALLDEVVSVRTVACCTVASLGKYSQTELEKSLAMVMSKDKDVANAILLNPSGRQMHAKACKVLNRLKASSTKIEKFLDACRCLEWLGGFRLGCTADLDQKKEVEFVQTIEKLDRVCEYGKLIDTEDLSRKDHNVQELVDKAFHLLNDAVEWAMWTCYLLLGSTCKRQRTQWPRQASVLGSFLAKANQLLTCNDRLCPPMGARDALVPALTQVSSMMAAGHDAVRLCHQPSITGEDARFLIATYSVRLAPMWMQAIRTRSPSFTSDSQIEDVLARMLKKHFLKEDVMKQAVEARDEEAVEAATNLAASIPACFQSGTLEEGVVVPVFEAAKLVAAAKKAGDHKLQQQMMFLAIICKSLQAWQAAQSKRQASLGQGKPCACTPSNANELIAMDLHLAELIRLEPKSIAPLFEKRRRIPFTWMC